MTAKIIVAYLIYVTVAITLPLFIEDRQGQVITINSKKTSHLEANQETLGNPIENYGKWCGPGHGGYDDCCNGTFCPSCGSEPGLGNWSFQLNLDCLKECPPVDNLDLSCAQHDTCCGLFGAQCPSIFPSEHCFCNGILAQNACHFDQYNKVCLVFSSYDYGLSCWACGGNHSNGDTTSLIGNPEHECLGESHVYYYAPDSTVSLAMLEEFNRTGVTNFLSTSRKLGQNCTASRM